MAKKIFETQFEKGSLIDAIENRILTPTGTVILKRTDKGTASLFDGGISDSGARLESDFKITTIPFTVVVNFKFIKSLSTGYFVSQTQQNDPGRFIIDIQTDDKLEFFLGGNSFKTNALVNHKWYQAIFTRDGDGVCRFYLNNEYLGTYTNNNAIPLNSGFEIGGSSVVTKRTIFGYINKIIVYDGVISTVQREKHYQEFLQSQPTEKPVRGFELVKPTDLSYEKDRGLLAAYNFKRNGDTLVDISGNGYNFTIEPGTVERDNGLYFPMTRATITTSITFPAGSKTVCWRGAIHSIPGSFARIYSSYIMFNTAFNLFYYRAASDTIITLATGFTTADFNKEFDFVYVQEGNSSQKLYINGVLMGSSTETITSDQLIGEINSTANGGFTTHKDLRFYTRAFSEQEIKDYHNSFIKPVILEDFSNYAVGETRPKEWQIISGEFEIKEDTEKKYLECTSTGTIKINHNTTTDADTSIDYYDGASWTTFSGTLRDLITTHAWLSKDGNYLEFSLTSGKAIANIKIYDGVRQ